MKPYVVLLRGINVGGKNKIPMVDLRKCLVDLGFSNVATYIASGNVILESEKNAIEIKNLIEKAIPTKFHLDSELIKIVVLSPQQLRDVVRLKPKGFGDFPEKFHSDVIFLMGITPAKAFEEFNPRDGVDRVWKGKCVIYSERLSSQRTKSRLSKILASPLYRSITIRNWNTTVKLLELIEERQQPR